jgi:uncharacterized protein (TIGR00369 family)
METDQEATASIHATMPFTNLLNLRIVEVGPERAVAAAEWASELCTTGGVLHGGYLMAAADTLGALCAGQHLPPNSVTTTIESKTNMLRPVT